MSNFSDNLPACDAYAVIFVCRFGKGLVAPFQRAGFTLYFTLDFFFDYDFKSYVFSIIRFIRFTFCFFVKKLFCFEKKKIKEGRDEVDFLHTDKHQTFIKVDTISFGGHGQSCPHYPK